MLWLRAFRPSDDKIVKIQLHPTHPWLLSADASDFVSVWNWEHRQVIYELKAAGVDERRLVGAKLEKLAEGESESKGKPTEAIRGGSVKQVNFYDDDVRYWQLWRNRSAAAEAPSAVSNVTSAFTSPAPSTKGRHFLVICCENKAIFLDLVTMRGRDVPKQELDNKSLLCMVFLARSAAGDGPLVAFGGLDGVIRVLSMITWKLVRRYTGGHKGSNSCLMTFMASSGEGDAIYLYYEKKNVITMQGDIAVARSVDKGATWQQLGIALDEDWHLSYPYVFSYHGQIYMMPESSEKGELRVYRSLHFPLQWKLEKVIMRKPMVDSFVINHKGMFWLFGSDHSSFGSK